MQDKFHITIMILCALENWQKCLLMETLSLRLQIVKWNPAIAIASTKYSIYTGGEFAVEFAARI